jgi:hypothetical protein
MADTYALIVEAMGAEVRAHSAYLRALRTGTPEEERKAYGAILQARNYTDALCLQRRVDYVTALDKVARKCVKPEYATTEGYAMVPIGKWRALATVIEIWDEESKGNAN